VTESPRLIDEVEPLVKELYDVLPTPAGLRLTRIIILIVERVEALEDRIPIEVLAESRTEKNPPGPTILPGGTS
jgi:hypothetical protein